MVHGFFVFTMVCTLLSTTSGLSVRSRQVPNCEDWIQVVPAHQPGKEFLTARQSVEELLTAHHVGEEFLTAHRISAVHMSFVVAFSHNEVLSCRGVHPLGAVPCPICKVGAYSAARPPELPILLVPFVWFCVLYTST